MMAAPTSKNSIPIVDLSAFTFSTEYTHAQQEAARDLVKACQNLGFSYIVGHGVSDSLLLEAFSWSKKLFDLQHADKMKAPHPAGAMPHRGYSHPGLEKVYSKEERSDAGAKESNGDSLRKIMDFKVSDRCGVRFLLVDWINPLRYSRKAMRSVASIIHHSQTSGFQKRHCQVSVLS